MGATLNSLPLDKIDGLGNITPDRADWLTSHADATGLSVVEVERLWHRFQQITGSRDKTKLYPDKTALPDEMSNDIFVKNILKHFPRLKTDDDAIPFGYFLAVMKWLDEANLHKKLDAVYLYLNNGDPIDTLFLSKLLKHVYPEKSNDEIKELAIDAMLELGSTEKGQLNQQEFVAGVQRLMPHDQLEHIFRFHIIPMAIVNETNTLPPLPLPPTTMRDAKNYDSNDLVTEDQLKQIAIRASKRHWTKLALTLGFLEYDIEAYKAQNNYNAEATMYDLLELWRDQEVTLATKTRLREYLKQSGFDGLTSILK